MNELNDIILSMESNYSLDRMKRFSKYHFYNFNKRIWLVSVIAVILVIIGALDSNFEFLLRLLLCMIGIIWFVEILVIPGMQAKKAYQASKLKDAKIKANFNQEKIELQTIKDGDVVSSTQLKYEDLVRVCDLKEDMYLYISSNQAFCLDKTTMNGDYEKVASIIKEKLDKNYIMKNK